ncbi:hypothetical protein MPSEU_000839800 [Mayamaea pseudoterrestris]|nr:hypothetical protein MPSEU_000839800 [Mayamaea pseudoterrestris]
MSVTSKSIGTKSSVDLRVLDCDACQLAASRQDASSIVLDDAAAPNQPDQIANDDVLTLNVGGKATVQTLRSTLTFVEGSVLAARFKPNWEHSLPRDKNGNIFVDQDPDLFLPLIGYLRQLASSPNILSRGVLPMTPTFGDAKTEAAFRSMIDSLLLTNVLYNYEVQRYENDKFVTVTQSSSILDYVMDCVHPTGSTPPSCVSYCLGRPFRSLGPCHERKVQAFTAVCDISSLNAGTRVVVGWTFRGPDSVNGTTHLIKSIVYDTKLRTLKWIYKDGKWMHGKALRLSYTDASSVAIQCSMPIGTRDLEWYIDGAFVASTSQAVRHGDWKAAHGVWHLGVELPEHSNYEWTPYIKVYASGRCQFSHVELED